MILKGIFHPRGVFHESGNTVICLAKALIIWWNSVAICYYLDCNDHCHWLEDTSCLCSVLTHAFIFLCCLPHNHFCIITQQDAFKPEFSKTHFFHMGFNTRKNVPNQKIMGSNAYDYASNGLAHILRAIHKKGRQSFDELCGCIWTDVGMFILCQYTAFSHELESIIPALKHCQNYL